MGRLLEALKAGSKFHAEQCVVDWTLREPEEVPYIEVGSGKKIEGSADVMAIKHPPQAAVQPPHTSVLSRDVAKAAAEIPPASRPAAETQVITLTKPKAAGVTFEPWPALLVPSRGIASDVIAFHQPEHTITRQYAAILGKILEGQTADGSKAILLSGCKAQSGTTTALLNLAIVAAVQDKRRLVLVDAHLMRPALAQRLGLAPGLGLQEVLAGTAAIEPAVVKTPVAGMYLLAARGEECGTLGQLNTEALTWVISWLKERFDLVLFDGPGLDDATDIAMLAPICDAVYLVLPQADTPPAHRELAQTIGRRGGRVMGLIRTDRVMGC